jgi:predicted Zn-dependent protease
VYSDGSSQISEVHAGSGYYSQSSPSSFFSYSDANPPVRVRVRWPSGLASESVVTPHSTSLSVAPPAAAY